jgi:hypothetical protein
LLQRPGVAVRVAERDERAPRLNVNVAGVYAALDELPPGGLDIRNNDLHTFLGTRRHFGDAGAHHDGTCQTSHGTLPRLPAAAATALLIASAAFHRVVYRRRLKHHLVRVANRLALSGLVLLLLAMISAILLILDVVIGFSPALFLALGGLSWFVTWWFILPVWSRLRHQGPPHPPHAQHIQHTQHAQHEAARRPSRPSAVTERCRRQAARR